MDIEKYTNIVIRRAGVGDVHDIVDVHLSSFQGFFLTFLGAGFLRELYLSTLEDYSGFGFVADYGKRICGFVTGTSQPSGFYFRLIRHRWYRFALAAALPTLRKPAIVFRLFRALAKPNFTTNQEGRGTLMSIAVLPDAQGMGIGKLLVKEFLGEATKRGLDRIDLKTDRDNNEGANIFYKKLGFECEQTFTTPEGRKMKEYVIDLNNRISNP